VRVTHTDGAPLPQPFTTNTLTIAPGERYDVELALTADSDQNLTIANQRNAGLRIPIRYTATGAAPTASPYANSPYVAPAPTPLDPVLANQAPDITMVLGEGMGMGGGMMGGGGGNGGMGGGMGGGGMGGMGMVWTINGQVYPDTQTYQLGVGQTYVIRFSNRGMERITHPMHIHGAHFRVLADNGTPETREIWKDTLSIPWGHDVDIAVTFDKPGEWMVHCHILDHEDGGMMTSFNVS
jgi:FtsP/CotA-like multicopper oxidase with cupredoxin domain